MARANGSALKMAVSQKAFLVIAILAAGIVLGYLHNAYVAGIQQAAYRQGYVQGASESALSIVQQTRECSPAVVTIGNQTFRFIDVVCLEQIGVN